MSKQDLDWLAAQAPERNALDPGARERALHTLVQHMVLPPSERGVRLGSVFRTRRFGFAAVTAAAAAAALVLNVGDGNSPGRLLGRAAGPQAAAVHHYVAVRSPLMRLADYVSTSGAPTGDATLVARTTTGHGKSVTVYDLYSDNGRYFFSQTAGGLAGQVRAHHDLAGGLFAREIGAAKLGATGNAQAAAQAMADAPNPSHVIKPTQTVDRAAVAAKLAATGRRGMSPDDVGTLYDNWVWEDSQDAIIAGSGEPQVRAGVLRILATLRGVTVTPGTFGGQPTLVLTSGSPELGSGYAEQLTIDANTGVPIRFIGGAPGGPPAATVTYKVSRVTLAQLPTGASSGA